MPLVFGAGCYFSLAGRSTYVFKLQMIANTSSFKQCVKNNTLLSRRKHIYKQNVRTTIHKLDPIAADGRNAIILSWTISSKLYHITTAESQTFYFS